VTFSIALHFASISRIKAGLRNSSSAAKAQLSASVSEEKKETYGEGRADWVR
jgi:hypothetical protein